MYSVIYLVLIIIFFIFIYIAVNLLVLALFNQGRKEFTLKPKSKHRLANNYVYGTGTDPLSNGDLNCSAEDGQLIECDIDEYNELGRESKCGQCRQISGRCINIPEPIYSSTDPNTILIEPNTSADKGYCLPSSTIINKCTRRNGGKWILTQSENTLDDHDHHNPTDDDDDSMMMYTFQCYCSTPNFYQNEFSTGNDCTRFVGCRNGTIKDDNWTSYENIRCDCNLDLYEEKYGSATEAPSCLPLNLYRRKYSEQMPAPFEILDEKYISTDYLKLLRGGGGGGGDGSNEINLPNPCTFDLVTKKFIKGIGRVVFDSTEQIAYCVSTHSNYKTITLSDDYLLGNEGKYANAVFLYRLADVSSDTNTDADDNYNKYEDGIMYETCRKGTEREHIKGVRLPYRNFTIHLPYLENDSFNMGNSNGRRYYEFPIIPSNRHKFTMVYLYDVATPDEKFDVIVGNMITYVPSFMTRKSDTKYRVYNGALACINVNEVYKYRDKRAFRIMYPVPPGTLFKSKLGTKGIKGDLISPDPSADTFTAGYGLHVEYNGKIEPYTELFTGTLFTYTIDKKIYTRPVSCGDMILTIKYRQHYDLKWHNIPNEPIIGAGTDVPFQFAVTGRDAHMFTRNSYDIERNDIGVPKQTIARYNISNERIEFPKFYS